MTAYIIQRLVASIPVLLMVGVITFFMVDLAPGDAAALIAGDQATPEDVESIREHLGLNEPVHTRFLKWVSRTFRGDLGTSVFSHMSVGSLVLPRIEPTLSLAISAIVLSVIVGVPIGVLAAWRQGSLIDRGVMAFSALGFSVPAFWMGFILIWIFSVNLDIFPTIGLVSIRESFPGFFKSIALPSVTVALQGSALLARMSRSSILEVLREDYIRTARAKCLSERIVMFRHALRAGSVPIITVTGLLLAGLIAGVVVTEVVFTIPGLGRLIADSVVKRDFPVIQSMLMLLAVIFVFMNLAVDILYAYLDPRVKY